MYNFFSVWEKKNSFLKKILLAVEILTCIRDTVVHKFSTPEIQQCPLLHIPCVGVNAIDCWVARISPGWREAPASPAC